MSLSFSYYNRFGNMNCKSLSISRARFKLCGHAKEYEGIGHKILIISIEIIFKYKIISITLFFDNSIKIDECSWNM
jgi:hypothetical protein